MDFVPAVLVPAALSPQPLWFLCAENEVVLRREPGPVADGLPRSASLLPSTDELRALGLDLGGAQLVGTLGGQDCLALPFEQPRGSLPAALELVGLRKLWGRLDDALFPIAGRANQLAHFAATHRFCGRCGGATARDPVERAFRCPACRLTCYPRISPAIITLVRRGDEALLATSGRFPVPFFSTLAGFSEVGESLEETLAREVREEVSLEVQNVRYFGSQPWPFPHSLMIGFTADYAGGEIKVDGVEIKEARFFRADALPQIPPRLSIARRLIDAWVREVTGRDAPAP